MLKCDMANRALRYRAASHAPTTDERAEKPDRRKYAIFFQNTGEGRALLKRVASSGGRKSLASHADGQAGDVSR